jgi:ferredoxin
MANALNLLILYYSGTGNTKFACAVAKLAAERMGLEVTMQTYEKSDGVILSDYDIFCFASPVQAWQPTKNVEKYIKSMPSVDGKTAFLLTSSGGTPSQTPALMARWLKRKGIRVIGDYDLASPDSWPVTRGFTYKYDEVKPEVESVRELVRFTERMLLMHGDLLKGKPVELPSYRVIPTPLFWISRFERMPKRHPGLVMGKKRVIESECTRCEICVKRCPAGAIRLDPYPSFGRECITCWRCVNNCPEDCITTGIDNRKRHYKGFRHGHELLEAVGLEGSQKASPQ